MVDDGLKWVAVDDEGLGGQEEDLGEGKRRDDNERWERKMGMRDGKIVGM